jgi:hypothetical protein
VGVIHSSSGRLSALLRLTWYATEYVVQIQVLTCNLGTMMLVGVTFGYIVCDVKVRISYEVTLVSHSSSVNEDMW